jgi:peptidoglycan/LPS O-acetylase OafA/YrhL
MHLLFGHLDELLVLPLAFWFAGLLMVTAVERLWLESQRPARGRKRRRARAEEPKMPDGTLGAGFDPTRNSLNFLRLLLASAVVFYHSFPAGGFGPGSIGKTPAGDIAVDGFFAISGFLIARSAWRNSTGRYLWQRALRIYPAYWVCLVVTAATFGAAAWLHAHHGLSGYFAAPRGPLGFVVSNADLHLRLTTISGTPMGVPYPYTWNASVWTLEWEFKCYLIAAALAIVGLLKRPKAIVGIFVVFWLTAIAVYVFPAPRSMHYLAASYDYVRLIVAFLAGTVVFVLRDRIPDSKWLALAMAVVAVMFLNVSRSEVLTAPAFAYVCLWLGIHLPFHRVGVPNDISYGVYIYAFPVQQTLALWHVQRYGYTVFALCSMAGTLPLAAASWWIIEKPALTLKRWRPRRPVTAVRHLGTYLGVR